MCLPAYKHLYLVEIIMFTLVTCLKPFLSCGGFSAIPTFFFFKFMVLLCLALNLLLHGTICVKFCQPHDNKDVADCKESCQFMSEGMGSHLVILLWKTDL